MKEELTGTLKTETDPNRLFGVFGVFDVSPEPHVWEGGVKSNES